MKNWVILMILFCTNSLFAQIPYNSVVSTTHLSNITSPTGCSNFVCSILGDNNFNNAAAEVPVGSIFQGTWADNNAYFANPAFPELLLMNCHTLSETWGLKLKLSDGSYTSENIYTMNNTFGNIVWNLSLFCGATSSSTSSTYKYQRAYKFVDFEDFFIPGNLGVIGAEIRMISDGAGTPDPVGIRVLENAVPLPATFGSFSYDCSQHVVEASWNMYSETDVDKYIVEGTTDNEHFTELASIAAQGNSQMGSEYRVSFPSSAAELVRITQVDFNGHQIVLGYFGVVCQVEELSVFPNPTRDLFSMVAPASYGSRRVRLFASNGAILIDKQIDFSVDISWQVDMQQFASGIYLVEISNERDREQVRIVKE